MQTLADFFAMGGHGEFVWSAYGIAAVVLIGLLAVSWQQLRHARDLLRRYDSRRDSDRP